MAREIERKFLVNTGEWRPSGSGRRICQGFLSSVPERVVRVRIQGEMALLTVKGITVGATRAEFEYEIPPVDAETMIADMCEKPLIVKTRYLETIGGQTFEVDVFEGENAGLVVAEIELESEDEAFDRPAWLGEEVTHDSRYYNSNLVARPFRSW